MSATRWLVVRGGALGDFVLTTPAIRALRDRAAPLHLLCNPRFAAAFPDLADEVGDLHGSAGAWLFGGRPPGPLPDAALVYTPGVADRLRDLGVPRVLQADVHPAPGASALKQLWAPVAPLAGPQPPAPHTAAIPEAIARMERLLGGKAPLVLAPGAAAPRKQWPHFALLAELLSQAGVEVWWAPGLDEAPLDPGLPGRVLPVLALPDLVAVAARCRAWVGNDTGTSHLAAAAGAPTHVLFGPTDPATWCPAGAQAWPFHSDPAALVASLAASPPLRPVNFP